MQIKSSKRNFKATDGLLTDIVLGDVLVRQVRLSRVIIKLSSKYRSPEILAKSLQMFARYADPDYVDFIPSYTLLKVKAVGHHALRDLVDVIVFSVQGYRRLIDFLAGGMSSSLSK